MLLAHNISASDTQGLQVASAEQNDQAALKAQELSEKYGKDENFFKGQLNLGIETNMIGQIVRRTAADNLTPYTGVSLKAMEETIQLLWAYGQKRNEIITATALYLNWTGTEEWKPQLLNNEFEA